jgi:hypothetical protein
LKTGWATGPMPLPAGDPSRLMRAVAQPA